MIGADQLAEVQRDVRDLVAQQPSEAEERRRVADDLLRLGHGPVPVGLLLLVAVAHRGRGGRRVRPSVTATDGRRAVRLHRGPQEPPEERCCCCCWCAVHDGRCGIGVRAAIAARNYEREKEKVNRLRARARHRPHRFFFLLFFTSLKAAARQRRRRRRRILLLLLLEFRARAVS